MKIQLKDGRLFIDGDEVLFITFANKETQWFPVKSNEEIELSDGTNSTASATGSGNVVISGKNIVSPGSKINVKGDFRVGDG